jgi:hypothetical protein
MSSKAFTRQIFAWLAQVNGDRELPASAAKVAIFLGSRFNEEEGGVAWPSCRTISDAIGRSEPVVIDVVHRLEAAGHVKVEWGKQGRGSSNRYWMIIKPRPADVSETNKPRPVEVSGKKKISEFTPENLGIHPGKPRPTDQTLSNITIEEPSKVESIPARASKTKEETPPPAGDSFEEFWRVYPKKVAREAARRAFDAAIKRGADPGIMIVGAQRYAAERAGQPSKFTKFPETWLRDGRWEDEGTGAVVLDEHGNIVAVDQEEEESQSDRVYRLAEEMDGGAVMVTKSLTVRQGGELARSKTKTAVVGAMVMREILDDDLVRRLLNADRILEASKHEMWYGRHGLDAAKSMHRRWLPNIERISSARAVLDDVVHPRYPLTQSQARAMLHFLFHAMGKRKSDESAAKLHACTDIFSPTSNALGKTLRLWKPVPTHPLILALAIKQLMAEKTFEPSEAELREALAEVEESLSAKRRLVKQWFVKLGYADKILFTFDRPAWDAQYASVGSDIVAEMAGILEDSGDRSSPHWQALDDLFTAREAEEQAAWAAKDAEGEAAALSKQQSRACSCTPDISLVPVDDSGEVFVVDGDCAVTMGRKHDAFHSDEARRIAAKIAKLSDLMQNRGRLAHVKHASDFISV